MENYILLSEDFIRSTYGLNNVEPINEGIFKSINKNALSKILAPTIATGNDIFKSINENVDEIENLIEHYNDELKVNKKTAANRAEQMLSVEFDKNKLKLTKLIELTSIKPGSFTGDILLSNIMNYRVILSPIRMAKIMALGYKYYMTIIRQALQQALVSVELNADMFFTLVRDGVAGTDKKIMEMRRNAIEEVYDEIKKGIGNGYLNTTTGTTQKVSKKETKKWSDYLDQMRKVMSFGKQAGADNYGNYRQNIFQEAGRHVESLLKEDNQKELAAMVEQFNNLAQKPQKEGKDNMLGTYSQAVKLSAEARANKVCAKIHMNLVDILKMFSIRAQEGLSSLFEGLDKRESWEKEQDDLKKQLEEQSEIIKKQQEKESQMEENSEFSESMKRNLERLGFSELPLQDMYDDVVLGISNPNAMLRANGFSNSQILDIWDRRLHKVTDYTYNEDDVNNEGRPAKWYLKK